MMSFLPAAQQCQCTGGDLQVYISWVVRCAQLCWSFTYPCDKQLWVMGNTVSFRCQ